MYNLAFRYSKEVLYREIVIYLLLYLEIKINSPN